MKEALLRAQDYMVYMNSPSFAYLHSFVVDVVTVVSVVEFSSKFDCGDVTVSQHVHAQNRTTSCMHQLHHRKTCTHVLLQYHTRS